MICFQPFSAPQRNLIGANAQRYAKQASDYAITQKRISRLRRALNIDSDSKASSHRRYSSNPRHNPVKEAEQDNKCAGEKLYRY